MRLAQGRHDAFGDPVVVGAARVQHALVAALDAVGPGVLAVALLVLLLVAAVLARRAPAGGRRRPASATVDRPPVGDDAAVRRAPAASTGRRGRSAGRLTLPVPASNCHGA
ncbi:hypothetical protein [Micromonospora sp. DT47]|uniref:hypothetical protein n=1 Tax=Micromonospora sp. DT47 TaxID=3393431 RepID=UPI003CF9D06D